MAGADDVFDLVVCVSTCVLYVSNRGCSSVFKLFEELRATSNHVGAQSYDFALAWGVKADQRCLPYVCD